MAKKIRLGISIKAHELAEASVDRYRAMLYTCAVQVAQERIAKGKDKRFGVLRDDVVEAAKLVVRRSARVAAKFR